MVTLGLCHRHNKFSTRQAGHGASWCDSCRESRHNNQDSVHFNIFSLDITFLLSELGKRKRLRQFARISELPSAQSIYQFIGKFEEYQFIHLIY